MAMKISFAGANISKPGSYSQSTVNLAGGFPLTATGVVAIIGEAQGGAPGSSDGVQTFTSADLAALTSKYKSGPIVDAARLLVAPARDGRVANGASIIRVYKTNASAKASVVFENAAAADLFTFESKNFGEDENLISIEIEAGVNPSARVFTISKGSLVESLPENARVEWMSIQYTGVEATCTMTIQNGILATSSAESAENLSISLAGKSLKDLVDLIANHSSGVYTASTSSKIAAVLLASDLDPISTATSIKASAVKLYAQQKEMMDIINGQSQLVSVSRIANVEGIVAASDRVFLSGGALGASSNTDFQTGFDALLSFRCNTVVPLVSQDASDLATEGLTDPTSSFTVSAINVQAITHCITASNTKNRSERNCYLSFKGSFADAQDAALDINHERASMLFQDVQVLNSAGELVWIDPWAAAAILAGIQAGTEVGTPATFKGINVNGLDHEDYNSKTQVDLAIDAGLLPLEERDSGGFRVVVHNSTYSKDANFVYNRPSVLAAADAVAYDLRAQLESIFVGTKARTGTAESIKNTVISIMSKFLAADIIVGDDANDGLGWKDLLVSVNGNTANIDITITPVQGVDFVLARISLESISQSA